MCLCIVISYVAFGNYEGLPVFKEHSLIRIFHSHSEIRIIHPVQVKSVLATLQRTGRSLWQCLLTTDRHTGWAKTLRSFKIHHSEPGREYLHSMISIRAPRSSGPLCRSQFLLSRYWWGKLWAMCQHGNPWSSSTRRWQLAVPFPITSQTGSERSAQCKEQNTGEWELSWKGGKQTRLQKTSPRRNCEGNPFVQADPRTALQLPLFTSSNSHSKCFQVLLHFFFFLWKQKWQQLKQNWEWENPKIEIITNQTRGLYTGWWSHWPALPSNFSSCRLWWVLYF